MNDAVPAKQSRRDLKEALLEPEMQAIFGALVPSHMTPERMLRLSIACITRTPKLLEVPQVQVLGALVQCAGIGLEPNSPLRHVHLIPFFNNTTKRYELQTIIGYRGFVELGRRTGKQKWVHGDVVRPGDTFEYAYGNDAHLRHRPGRGAQEREAPTDAYCFVQLDDGFAFVVLPEWEILRHRQHSFAWRKDGEKSPWGQHPDRMWRKTAIRVLYSGGEVPLDTELAMAVNTDDRRMDYRAMGELALRGGKSALEHLKEGMDTFVSEQEDEPEPESGQETVELRSQVRASSQAPQTAPGRPAQPTGEAWVATEPLDTAKPSDASDKRGRRPYAQIQSDLIKAIGEAKTGGEIEELTSGRDYTVCQRQGLAEDVDAAAERRYAELAKPREGVVPDSPAENRPPDDTTDAQEPVGDARSDHPEDEPAAAPAPGRHKVASETTYKIFNPNDLSKPEHELPAGRWIAQAAMILSSLSAQKRQAWLDAHKFIMGKIRSAHPDLAADLDELRLVGQ